MSTVQIRIYGRDYALACDDGEEEHLRLLADEVDERARALAMRMRANPGESLLLLLTSLTMADELTEIKRENEAMRSEMQGIAPSKFAEMEYAMASTLDDIAERIERIAQQIEIG